MVDDEHELFRTLYAEHYPAVLGYCLRRVHRDNAQDLTADVFSVAWRKRDALPEAEFVLPWLYAVAAKTIANHRRALRRRSSLLDKARSLAYRSEASPEVQVVRRTEDTAVIDAVRRLRPKDREVILLSAWEGLSAPQIAARFEISVDAAEKRLNRAKQRLGTELGRADKRLEVTPRVVKEGGMR